MANFIQANSGGLQGGNFGTNTSTNTEVSSNYAKLLDTAKEGYTKVNDVVSDLYDASLDTSIYREPFSEVSTKDKLTGKFQAGKPSELTTGSNVTVTGTADSQDIPLAQKGIHLIDSAVTGVIDSVINNDGELKIKTPMEAVNDFVTEKVESTLENKVNTYVSPY